MFSDDEKKPLDDSRFRELSPGKLLVWARERAGLSQEQVAKELYMTLTKVRALESDDFRYMGSDTFTRGYLRSYATLVKVDVAQVLAAYDRHALAHGLIEQVLPQRAESANKPLWQFIVLVLLALLVLWLISVWFFNKRQQPVYDRSAAVVPPTITALNAPSVSEFSSAESSESSASAVSSGGVSQASANALISLTNAVEFAQNASSASVGQSAIPVSSVASSVQKKPAAQQTNSSLLDTISFNFTAECWLEVSDARGDVLVADLQSAGNRLQLQGKAPFDVKLGNSPAAKIELNGDSIAVVPALGTNVLMLKVGKPTRD
jgi:cytoskeleton protein RodZ